MITVITPELSTLTVELKVIKVGNKQMTISVFKQIPEENCFDDKFSLTGNLWGKVNIRPETWIVFQKGSELRKMSLTRELGFRVTPFNKFIKDRYENKIPWYRYSNDSEFIERVKELTKDNFGKIEEDYFKARAIQEKQAQLYNRLNSLEQIYIAV